MAEVRESCDALELMVADEKWPLPKYREMLFPGGRGFGAARGGGPHGPPPPDPPAPAAIDGTCELGRLTRPGARLPLAPRSAGRWRAR
jgi:hypothetical protein